MTALHRWLLVGLILLGFGLRICQIDSVPLRGDEAFTAQNWAMQPLSDSLPQYAAIDPQPPLAYALFRGWSLVTGISEFSLRVLPALINTLGIAALYALGRHLFGPTAGLLAALIWALHPDQIWHAQDARNYAIWSGLSVIGLATAVRALRTDKPSRWAYYILAASLALFTYYLELLTLAALGLYALIFHRQKWRGWLSAFGVLALLFGLWLMIFIPLVQSSPAYAGTSRGFSFERVLTQFLPTLTFGSTLPDELRLLTGTGVLVAMVVGLTLITRYRRRVGLFLGLLWILPLIGLALAATRLNVFEPRYVLASAPAYTLIGVGMAWLLVKDGRWRWLSLVVVGMWLVLIGISLTRYYVDPATRKAPDWPGLASYLEENVSDGDLIIQTGTDAAFGYYYNRADIAAIDIGLPARPEQPVDEITATLERLTPDFDGLWIVGRSFREWPNYGIVENWVQTNLQEIVDVQIDGLPARYYRPWQVDQEESTAESITMFGEVARLRSATVLPLQPDSTLIVWLVWEPLRTTERPLKAFVHLVGPTNPATGTPLWAQDDQEPQSGRAATTAWDVNSLYRDVYVLSITGIPAGDYQLLVGLYDPVTNARLETTDGHDSVAIGTINLP